MSTQQLIQGKDSQTILALSLGPLIWFLHLNILNMVTTVACKWGWFPFTVAGMSGLRFIQMMISFIALLPMLYMTYLPWRSWRKFQTKDPGHNPRLLQDTEEDRRPLIAFLAMLTNALLTLFVLASFLLVFVLTTCPAH